MIDILTKSDLDIISKQIISAVCDKIEQRIPLDVDLWDIDLIAQFLKRNPASVRMRVVTLDTFPKAIRLPSVAGKATSHPLYKASEVIEWTKKYKDKN